MMNITDRVRARFFSHVDVRSESECWNWTGYKNAGGYGKFGIRSDGKHFSANAHRVSWVIANGEIPTGIYVCHLCDNRACCNPKHLWLGTHQENITDMVLKGRSYPRKGELHPRTKLSLNDVKCIRHLYFAERRTQKELGEFFGLARSSISNIVTGYSWSA
jgi:hypothetical protein